MLTNSFPKRLQYKLCRTKSLQRINHHITVSTTSDTLNSDRIKLSYDILGIN